MKVTATLQAEGNSPVDMVWARDTDALGVIESVAQLIQHDRDESPWTPRTLAITIELDRVNP